MNNGIYEKETIMPARKLIFRATLLLALVYKISCNNDEKHSEGLQLATNILSYYYVMFTTCLGSSMPNQQFLTDNLKSYVNYPSKTTVGYAPKFTSNRKFFANMITSTAFKEMLAKDEEELRKNVIKKLKYCDTAVMDQELLKDFYYREVDQTKM